MPCHLLQPLGPGVTASDRTWHLQTIPPSTGSPAPRTPHPHPIPGAEPDLVATTDMLSLPAFPWALALPWSERGVREPRRVQGSKGSGNRTGLLRRGRGSCGATRGNVGGTLREGDRQTTPALRGAPVLPDGAEIHNVLRTEITTATASFSSLSLSLRNSSIND